MHRKPIAVGEPPMCRARGLGVSDALALELTPNQLPWLVDELDELRGPLEEQIQRETRRSGEGRSSELEARQYELLLLRLMRAQLPRDSADEPLIFVGPSGLVETVVHGVMRDVAGALSELAAQRQPDAQALRQTATAAAAWAQTLADCRAVIGFTFDPDADPAAAW